MQMNKTIDCPSCGNNYEAVIEFDYQPEEKEERDYPGCAEDVEVTDIEPSCPTCGRQVSNREAQELYQLELMYYARANSS